MNANSDDHLTECKSQQLLQVLHNRLPYSSEAELYKYKLYKLYMTWRSVHQAELRSARLVLLHTLQARVCSMCPSSSRDQMTSRGCSSYGDDKSHKREAQDAC